MTEVSCTRWRCTLQHIGVDGDVDLRKTLLLVSEDPDIAFMTAEKRFLKDPADQTVLKENAEHSLYVSRYVGGDEIVVERM